MGVIKLPSSCFGQKLLCNQFMCYYICSRVDFGINYFKLCNFAVITIEFFATIDRGSILTTDIKLMWNVWLSFQIFNSAVYSNPSRPPPPKKKKKKKMIYTLCTFTYHHHLYKKKNQNFINKYWHQSIVAYVPIAWGSIQYKDDVLSLREFSS